MGDLLASSKALLDLDADGALVPHGLGGHGRRCLSWCVAQIDGYREMHACHQRLVRELDVALNGADGAAKQASLCDIVGQVNDRRWKLVRADEV